MCVPTLPKIFKHITRNTLIFLLSLTIESSLDPDQDRQILSVLIWINTAWFKEYFIHNNFTHFELYIHTDVSKMHNNRTIYYFSLKRVKNSKCITAVRGSLGYIPV